MSEVFYALYITGFALYVYTKPPEHSYVYAILEAFAWPIMPFIKSFLQKDQDQ